MHLKKLLAVPGLLLVGALLAHGASPHPEYLAPIDEATGNPTLPITNSIVTSWVISILIIFGVRTAVKVPKLKPERGQVFMEIVVDGVRGMIEPIVGKHMVKPSFWLLSGLFIFILVNNWSGLVPGVGTIGHVTVDAAGNPVEFVQAVDGEGGQWVQTDKPHLTPYIRPGNADLNMTLALACVAMGTWLFLVLKHAGVGVLFKDLFGNKANKKEVAGPVYLFLTSVFLFVGLIEVLSICLRPVTLSFRLFGNVVGGETLLYKMGELAKFIVPVPFYFLEVLVGFVQALVFTLLVSVYIGLICNHESEEGHDH